MMDDLPDDIDAVDYHCWLRRCDCEHSDIALSHYRKCTIKGRNCELLDRKRTKQNAAGRGRFHAKSTSGWYLNANYVRGSGAYRVKHGE